MKPNRRRRHHHISQAELFDRKVSALYATYAKATAVLGKDLDRVTMDFALHEVFGVGAGMMLAVIMEYAPDANRAQDSLSYALSNGVEYHLHEVRQRRPLDLELIKKLRGLRRRLRAIRGTVKLKLVRSK